jgi:hypothetical protein
MTNVLFIVCSPNITLDGQKRVWLAPYVMCYANHETQGEPVLKSLTCLRRELLAALSMRSQPQQPLAYCAEIVMKSTVQSHNHRRRIALAWFSGWAGCFDNSASVTVVGLTDCRRSWPLFAYFESSCSVTAPATLVFKMTRNPRGSILSAGWPLTVGIGQGPSTGGI